MFLGEGRISFQEHEWPDPGPGQLVIRVRANAICGTDRHQFLHGSAVIAGHEAAGEVVAGGAGTTTAAGTRGVVFFKEYCGTCRSCAAGHTSLCTQKRASTGMTTDGGYGPWEVIAERQFFPIPDELPFPLATMLLDAMGTTGHAWARAMHQSEDIRSVYIAGAGPIGLGLLVMGRIRMPESVPIYISDLSPWRREMAERLGGIPVDASDPESVRAIAPVDLSFDSTGKKIARQLAIDVLGGHGVFMVVGGQEGFSFDQEFETNLQYLLENRPLIEQLITHTFPVSEIERAFEVFLSGESGKVVVTQEGEPS
jgi:threonine dehydrogenase-like Zn-dependent dehydrogenase